MTALVTALFLMGLFLVSPGAAEEIRLRWYGPPGPLMADIAKELADVYREIRPDVIVEVGPTGQSTQQAPERFITQIVGGVIPEIVFVQYTDVAWWATLGFLMPIEDLIERAGIHPNEFVPGAWESMEFHGRLYALPLVIEPFGLVWGRETVDQAGIDPDQAPLSWSELVEHARKIVRTEGDATTHFGAQFTQGGVDITTSTFLNMGAQLNAPLADDKRTQMDDPRWQTILEHVVDLEITQGGPAAWVSYTQQFAGRQFGAFVNGWAHGKLGYTHIGPWVINQLHTVNPAAALGVGTLPVLEGGREVINAKGWAVAIPANAQHAEESLQFIRYLLGAGPMERWYRYQSSLPAHMDSLRHVMIDVIHELNSPQQRLAFAELASRVNVAAPPPHPISQPLRHELNRAIVRARGGQVNPAQVLADLNALLTATLQDLLE